MEIIKCYAWEPSLKARILQTRDTELKWIKQNSIVRAGDSSAPRRHPFCCVKGHCRGAPPLCHHLGTAIPPAVFPC